MRVLSGLLERLVGPHRRPLIRFFLLGRHRLLADYRGLVELLAIILQIRKHHLGCVAVHWALRYGHDDLLWDLRVILWCHYISCRKFDPLQAEKGIGEGLGPLLPLLVLAHAPHQASHHGV